MALLTATERAELRRDVAAASAEVDWKKEAIDAATQAIEDWLATNRASLKTAVDAATAPLGHTFTGAQVKKITKRWALRRFAREVD